MKGHFTAAATLFSLAVLMPVSMRAQCTDLCGSPTAAGGTIVSGGFLTSGTVQVPVNPAVAAAISTASTTIQQSVAAGQPLVDPATGATLPLSVSQVAVSMLTGATGEVRAQVRTALSRSGASGEVIEQLMNALPGLLTNPVPGQLATAVSAFNGLVNNASGAFLTTPPPEFQAIHAILLQVVAAGNSVISR